MNDLTLFYPSGDTVAFTPDALALKAGALEASALVGKVDDIGTNAAAVSAMLELRGALIKCENTRKQIKEPVLDLARRIDNAAKEFSKDLTAEYQRIERASADYHTAQLDRVRVQEAARVQEASRIAVETAAAVQAATTDEARKTAMERGEQAVLAIPGPVIGKAEGQTVRPDWDWAVTDIWTLARMHPGLVEITPRRQQIREVIAVQAAAGKPQIAGLRIWEVVKVGVRLEKGKTIEV